MKKIVVVFIAIIITLAISMVIISRNKVKCSELDEEACYNMKGCHGIYGSSTGKSFDIAYHSCVKISEDVYDAVEEDKSTCKERNGKWVIKKWSKLGSCFANYPKSQECNPPECFDLE